MACLKMKPQKLQRIKEAVEKEKVSSFSHYPELATFHRTSTCTCNQDVCFQRIKPGEDNRKAELSIVLYF